jgi:hypothetical protein
MCDLNLHTMQGFFDLQVQSPFSAQIEFNWFHGQRNSSIMIQTPNKVWSELQRCLNRGCYQIQNQDFLLGINW